MVLHPNELVIPVKKASGKAVEEVSLFAIPELLAYFLGYEF